MSHFPVTVFTKEKPTEEVIFKALQPFHEYECTGIKDEFVIPIDIHYEYEEAEEDYNKDSKGYSSLKEYLADYLGYDCDGEFYSMIEGRLHEFTNPNKKWDWYEIGGRWGSLLVTKEGNNVNSCKVSDLDFESENFSIKQKRTKLYNSMLEATNGTKKEWVSFKDIKKDLENRHSFYFNQEAIKEIRKVITNPFFNIDELNCSLDEYLKKSPCAFQTYNVLVPWEYETTENKGWYGGEMGWFGVGTDQKDWNVIFERLYEENKDCYVTIVDCHI